MADMLEAIVGVIMSLLIIFIFLIYVSPILIQVGGGFGWLFAIFLIILAVGVVVSILPKR
jgi:hypothetical protein